MARIVEQIKSQLEESSHIAEVQLVPDEDEDEQGGYDRGEGTVPDLRVMLHVRAASVWFGASLTHDWL